MVVSSDKPRKSLGEILAKMHVITTEQLRNAQDLQQEQGGKLGDILVSQGIIKAEELATFLSIQWNVPLIDLKRHMIQPSALKLIPEDMAKKHTLIPLDIIGDSLLVVMSDPEDFIAINDVSAQTNMDVKIAFAVASDIRQAIDINYRSNDEIQEKVNEFTPSIKEDRKVYSDILVETPITESLNLVIEQAVRDRASDIHLEPQENRSRIRYRIDGMLYDIHSIPMNVHATLVSRIKILAEMDITQSRQPQDGQFSMRIGDKDIDIRAATSDTVYGERVTLRILDKSLSLFTLPELGFSPDMLKKYRSILSYPFGIILISGPTGSGKTTTLYTSINQLDRNKRNIMTIEDPIEYRFTDISQSQVNPKAGVTFASGLRAILRQDPDIILIGEIRDKETAITAVQAAMTGHLVLSSIHANDAVSVLSRLIELGVDSSLISTTLIATVAQRMVRRICTNCSTQSQPSAQEKVAYEREMKQELTTLHQGTGCHLCANTGYKGRTGIFELLVMSEKIREMVLNNASIREIKEQAIKEGMVVMKRDGMQKVKDGVTTGDEVLSSVFTIS